ncbi:hypothetical protein BOTBODRAFT_182304 [Botryobasidium botryosum FD-172 SS1]|uniref:Uncharacterized protein n=1 Tax=Botryobasidium botryosum (strain FD-172 SS1) TaxID=930990 RepID=A0A067LRR8_BOTB1|nr:hypothetical protein BOTBODRAFT_182304 [Botryobasidium botryosum FD-172 SS1]
MQLRKRKNQEPQEEEPFGSNEGGTAKRTKKVHWSDSEVEAPGMAEQSAVKVKKVTLKVTSQDKGEVEVAAQRDVNEASLTVEELEKLVRQERVLGTAKRRGPKTEAVLARFTNDRIIYLQGLITLRVSSSVAQSHSSKAPHDAPQPPPFQLHPIPSAPAALAMPAAPTAPAAPITPATPTAPAAPAAPTAPVAPATITAPAVPTAPAAPAPPTTSAMSLNTSSAAPSTSAMPSATTSMSTTSATHTTSAIIPMVGLPATRTFPTKSAIHAVATPPLGDTSTSASDSDIPVNQDITPTAVSKPVLSSNTTTGSDAASDRIPNSFAEVFSLHSPSPEPYQLISDFGTRAGDEEVSEPAEKDRKIRPGPLTNEQKAQCRIIAEEYSAKMLQLAEEWSVHETTVSRQCGLGVKEHRGPNQWCIWQEWWFPENPQRATETKEEWRERCSQEYDSAKEGLSEEEGKAFRQELLDWRAKHEREEANIQIDKEGCWRKMKEVEATLLEWGAHLSTHWGIEIIGALLSTLPGDLTGRAASVLIGGSSKARSWWNTNTPAAKAMLHDLELSAWNAEQVERIRNNEPLELLRISQDHLRSLCSRGLRQSWYLVFPRREKDAYPWAQVPRLLISAQRTLIGWPAFALHPGQGEVKKLTITHLQIIARKILEDESGKTTDSEKLQYIPWTQAQKAISPSSPEYLQIPLVVDAYGRTLRTVKGVVDLQMPNAPAEPTPAAETKAVEEDSPDGANSKKKSLKGKEKALPVEETPKPSAKESKTLKNKQKATTRSKMSKKTPEVLPDDVDETESEHDDELIRLPSSTPSDDNDGNSDDDDDSNTRQSAHGAQSSRDHRKKKTLGSSQYGGGPRGGDNSVAPDRNLFGDASRAVQQNQSEIVTRAQPYQPPLMITGETRNNTSLSRRISTGTTTAQYAHI